MRFLKSIGAILVGFITVVFLSIATDAIVERLGIFPSPTNPEAYAAWMLVIALLYRDAFTILAGFITAKLARSRSLRHAVILGIIGTLARTAGVIAAWSFGSQWYPILLAATALPCTWLGGKLATK